MTTYCIQFKLNNRWLHHSRYDTCEEAKAEFNRRKNATKPWRLMKVEETVMAEKE